MARRLRLSTLSLLLAAGAGIAPGAHAQHTDSEVSSGITVMASAVLVLSIPFAASVGVAKLSDAAGNASSRERGQRPAKAVPLPPMQVKTVETGADGQRAVHLQVPDNAEQTATLRWPAVPDQDPAAAFSVGQTVRFTPTGVGAGWTVKAEDGTPLAFVPTAEAAQSNSSARW